METGSMLYGALKALAERFENRSDMSECDAAEFVDAAAEAWAVIEAFRLADGPNHPDAERHEVE